MSWELDEQKALIVLYNNGFYKELLNRYCHEGVIIKHLHLEIQIDSESKFSDEENRICSEGNVKPVQVYICSQSVIADTVEQGIKFLADYVLKLVEKGFLGC